MTSAGGRLGLPDLGYGVGLRDVHFRHLLHTPPAEWNVDWFEIISENFLDDHGFAAHALEHVVAHRPVVMHGVSLSIGSADPLDTGYLAQLRALADRVQPAWISDHLCWTGVNGSVTHDLLPMPLTRSSLDHVADRVRAVQDFLGRPLVLENPSTYLEFRVSEIPEWEFFGLLAEATGCGLLLDVNNLFVGAYNHGFDPVSYIEGLPTDHVVQVHLAGHRDRGTHLLDTHDRPVPDGVWSLYARVQARTGGVSTLLEWDADIPPFPELVAELGKARKVPVGPRSPTRSAIPAPSLPAPSATGGCDLRALQGWMLDACVRAVGPNDTVDVDTRVRGSDRCSAEGRLEIYARGYLARLLDSLRTEYRVLRALVGDQVFDLFARGYLEACPPRSSSMSDLGAGFASYLEETRPRPFGPPGAVDALPASLARLERACMEVGHARGVEGGAVDSAVDALRLMSTPGVVVATPESLRLLHLDFALKDALDAVERGDQATVPAAADTCYAVARSRFRVRVHVLERWQFELLRACGTGRDLPPAVAAAARRARLDIDQVWAALLLWIAPAVDAGLVTVTEE
jgi:uncharacterized protein